MLYFHRVFIKWFGRRECTICTRKIRHGEVRFCQHSYCKDCTIRWVEKVISGDIGEIKCCGKVIDTTHLLKYTTSKAVMQYRRAVKLKKLGGVVCPQCLQNPHTDCKSTPVSVTQTDSLGELTCSWCAQTFEIPAGDLNEWLKLEAVAMIHGWKRCPTCTTLIEKIEGCNHMSCCCGESWCYGCGMPYGEIDHDLCYNLPG